MLALWGTIQHLKGAKKMVFIFNRIKREYSYKVWTLAGRQISGRCQETSCIVLGFQGLLENLFQLPTENLGSDHGDQPNGGLR